MTLASQIDIMVRVSELNRRAEMCFGYARSAANGSEGAWLDAGVAAKRKANDLIDQLPLVMGQPSDHSPDDTTIVCAGCFENECTCEA